MAPTPIWTISPCHEAGRSTLTPMHRVARGCRSVRSTVGAGNAAPRRASTVRARRIVAHTRADQRRRELRAPIRRYSTGAGRRGRSAATRPSVGRPALSATQRAMSLPGGAAMFGSTDAAVAAMTASTSAVDLGARAWAYAAAAPPSCDRRCRRPAPATDDELLVVAGTPTRSTSPAASAGLKPATQRLSVVAPPRWHALSGRAHARRPGSASASVTCSTSALPRGAKSSGRRQRRALAAAGAGRISVELGARGRRRPGLLPAAKPGSASSRRLVAPGGGRPAASAPDDGRGLGRTSCRLRPRPRLAVQDARHVDALAAVGEEALDGVRQEAVHRHRARR